MDLTIFKLQHSACIYEGHWYWYVYMRGMYILGHVYMRGMYMSGIYILRCIYWYCRGMYICIYRYVYYMRGIGMHTSHVEY